MNRRLIYFFLLILFPAISKAETQGGCVISISYTINDIPVTGNRFEMKLIEDLFVAKLNVSSHCIDDGAEIIWTRNGDIVKQESVMSPFYRTFSLATSQEGVYQAIVKGANGGTRTFDFSIEGICLSPYINWETPAEICIGSDAVVTIKNSLIGVEYQVYNISQPISSVAIGNEVDLTISIPSANLALGNNIIYIKSKSSDCESFSVLSNAIFVNDIYPQTDLDLAGSIVKAGQNGTLKIIKAQSGVSYRIYDNAISIGTALIGNGNNLSLTVPSSSLTTENKLFSVKANYKGCENFLDTSVIIRNKKIPNKNLTVNGAAVITEGTAPVTIVNSEADINYQCFIRDNAVGSIMSGTGSELVFEISYSDLSLGENEIKVLASNTDTSLFLTNNVIIEAQEEALGIHKADFEFIKISPNPFEAQINIQLPIKGNYSVKLFDFTGRLMISDQFNSDKILLSTQDLSKGIYFVEILNEGNQRFFQSIVKE